MNDYTPMCEHHNVNYIQSGGYQNRDSNDSYSHKSHHDLNDSEKSLTELNNDVKNDLEHFKSCIHSMRTVHSKLFDTYDGKTTGVLPNKKSKPVNQEPQSKIDLEISITKFLNGQRVANMFVNNNVNDMIIKMKQNKKNCQTIYKNMERKIDEWSKSQNVSSEQTNRTEPPPPPQAHTEHVNVVFTMSGKSDDPLKVQKDPPPPIIELVLDNHYETAVRLRSHDIVKAVTDLEPPRTLKDVQSLNGKLAALSRFLSKGAEKSLPFFKTLKCCTDKRTIQWTMDAKEAFQKMKKFMEILQTLTAPIKGEVLLVVLLAEREERKSKSIL
ncbi:hypothetical protein Tco_1562021 [Tanacetum coccineum]